MRITLYSKPGCHLCEDVKFELLDLQSELGFDLVEENILDDPKMFEAYKYLIPVVVLESAKGEKTTYHVPIDRAMLRKAIRVSVRES